MNLDDLKQDWREQNTAMAEGSLEEMAASVQRRAARFETTITRRDWIEGVTAGVVCLAAGFFLYFNSMPLVMTLGVVLVMLAAVEVVVVMIWTRHRDPRPQSSASLREYVGAEVARLDRQIDLLRRVNWWYSGPLLGACGVFFLGVLLEVRHLNPWIWVAFLVAFAVCFFWAGNAIYRMNQRATVPLVLLRDQMNELLAALATEGA